MTSTDFRNGAARLWGALDRIALTAALAFAGYLFTAQQELRHDLERVSERASIVETIIAEGPRGNEIVSRLATLEAEIRELRHAINRAVDQRGSRSR